MSRRTLAWIAAFLFVLIAVVPTSGLMAGPSAGPSDVTMTASASVGQSKTTATANKSCPQGYYVFFIGDGDGDLNKAPEINQSWQTAGSTKVDLTFAKSLQRSNVGTWKYRVYYYSTPHPGKEDPTQPLAGALTLTVTANTSVAGFGFRTEATSLTLAQGQTISKSDGSAIAAGWTLTAYDSALQPIIDETVLQPLNRNIALQFVDAGVRNSASCATFEVKDLLGDTGAINEANVTSITAAGPCPSAVASANPALLTPSNASSASPTLAAPPGLRVWAFMAAQPSAAPSGPILTVKRPETGETPAPTQLEIDKDNPAVGWTTSDAKALTTAEVSFSPEALQGNNSNQPTYTWKIVSYSYGTQTDTVEASGAALSSQNDGPWTSTELEDLSLGVAPYFKPGAAGVYTIKVTANGLAGLKAGEDISATFRVQVMHQDIEVVSVEPKATAVAAGQPVSLRGTLEKIDSGAKYQWVQEASPSWRPVPTTETGGTSTGGSLSAAASAPVSLTVYPTTSTTYSLEAQNIGMSSPSMNPDAQAKVDVYTIEASSDSPTVVIPGVAYPLGVDWMKQTSGPSPSPAPTPTQISNAPKITWAVRSGSATLAPVSAEPRNDQMQQVTLANSQPAAATVDASYTVSNVPASVPNTTKTHTVSFPLQPALLQAVGDTEIKETINAQLGVTEIPFPLGWSQTPSEDRDHPTAPTNWWEQVNLYWTARCTAESGQALAPTDPEAFLKNGKPMQGGDPWDALANFKFRPDAAGEYELKVYAVPRDNTNAYVAAAGGPGVTFKFKISSAKAGQLFVATNDLSVLGPQEPNVALVDQALKFNVTVAEQHGNDIVTGPAIGHPCTIVRPDGTTQPLNADGSGTVTFTPTIPGSYTFRCTPSNAQETAATPISFTAIKPTVQFVQPTEDTTVEAGQDLTAVISLNVEGFSNTSYVGGVPTGVESACSLTTTGLTPASPSDLKFVNSGGTLRVSQPFTVNGTEVGIEIPELKIGDFVIQPDVAWGTGINSHKIYWTPNPAAYEITATVDGQPANNGAEAAYGDRVQLTVKPANDDYVIGNVSVTRLSGGSVPVSQNGDTWSFEMPTADVTVTVEPVANSVLTIVQPVSVDGVPQGTVTVTRASGGAAGSASQPLESGTRVETGTPLNVSYTPPADQSYKAVRAELTAAGTSQNLSAGNTANSWHFMMPSSSASVTVVAAPRDTYELIVGDSNVPGQNVTVQIPGNPSGSETIVDSSFVPAGATVSVSYTAPSGLALKLIDLSVVGSGGQKLEATEENGVFTFVMPAYSVTITPTLASSSQYTVTAAQSSVDWTVNTTLPVLRVLTVDSLGKVFETDGPQGLTYSWTASPSNTTISNQGPTLNLSEVSGGSGLVAAGERFICTVTAESGVSLSPSNGQVPFTVKVNPLAPNVIALSANNPEPVWYEGTTRPVLTVTARTSNAIFPSSDLTYTWIDTTGAVIVGATGPTMNLADSAFSDLLKAGTFRCFVSSNNDLNFVPAAPNGTGGLVEFAVSVRTPADGVVTIAAENPLVDWLVGTAKPRLVVTATSGFGTGASGLTYTWTGPDGNEIAEATNKSVLNLSEVANIGTLLGTSGAKTFTCQVETTQPGMQLMPANGVVQFTVQVDVEPAPPNCIALMASEATQNWIVGTTRPVLSVLAFDPAGRLVTNGLTYEWSGPNGIIPNQTGSTLNLAELNGAAALLGTTAATRIFSCEVSTSTLSTLYPNNTVNFAVNVTPARSGYITVAANNPVTTWTAGTVLPVFSVTATRGTQDVTNNLQYIWTDPDGNVISGQTGPVLNLAEVPNAEDLLGNREISRMFSCQVDNDQAQLYVEQDGRVSFMVDIVLPPEGVVTLSGSPASSTWMVGTTKPVLTVSATSSAGEPVGSGLTYTWTGPDNRIIAGQTGPTLNLNDLAGAETLLGTATANRRFTCSITSTIGIGFVPASGKIDFNVAVTPLPRDTIGLAAVNPVPVWRVGTLRPVLEVKAVNYQGNPVTQGFTCEWLGPDGQPIPGQTGMTLNLAQVSNAASMLGVDKAEKLFTCVVKSNSGGKLSPSDGKVTFTVSVLPVDGSAGIGGPTITLLNNTQVRVNTPVTVRAVLNGWYNPRMEWAAVGCGNPKAENVIETATGGSVTFTPTQTGRLQVKVTVRENGVSLSNYTSITVSDSSNPTGSPTSTTTTTTPPSDWPPTGGPSTPPSNPPASQSPSSGPSVSGGPSSGASASESASPGQSPSDHPSGGPSGPSSIGPSGQPSASVPPIQPNPSAPVSITVATVPGVADPVIKGLPISEGSATHTVAMLPTYITIPRGTIVEVMDANGTQEAPLFDPISTGQIARVMDSSGALVGRALAAVTGDVLGTGRLNIAQLVRLAQACTGERPLTGIYLVGGDFNNNNRIDIGDVVREAEMLR